MLIYVAFKEWEVQEETAINDSGTQHWMGNLTPSEPHLLRC